MLVNGLDTTIPQAHMIFKPTASTPQWALDEIAQGLSPDVVLSHIRARNNVTADGGAQWQSYYDYLSQKQAREDAYNTFVQAVNPTSQDTPEFNAASAAWLQAHPEIATPSGFTEGIRQGAPFAPSSVWGFSRDPNDHNDTSRYQKVKYDGFINPDGSWKTGVTFGNNGPQLNGVQGNLISQIAASGAPQQTARPPIPMPTAPTAAQSPTQPPSLFDTWQQYATSQGWQAPQPAVTQPQQQATPAWYNQAPSWYNQAPQSQPQQAAAPQTVAPSQMTLGQAQPQRATSLQPFQYSPQHQQWQQFQNPAQNRGFGGQQQGQQPFQQGGTGGGFQQRRARGNLGYLGQQLIA